MVPHTPPDAPRQLGDFGGAHLQEGSFGAILDARCFCGEFLSNNLFGFGAIACCSRGVSLSDMLFGDDCRTQQPLLIHFELMTQERPRVHVCPISLREMPRGWSTSRHDTSEK